MGDRSLIMTFLNEEGVRISITLPSIKDNLTEEEVSDAMDSVIAANIFDSTGGDLKLKHSAQVIERNVTALEVK